MSVEIIKVKTKRDLNDFIKFSFKLYKDDPNWVAPLIGEQKKHLDKSKNPFFEHSDAQLFLAIKNDEIVGRISAHTNRQHNKIKKDKTGFFGFFESINDQEVADALFFSAEKWNMEQGNDSMTGPENFSLHDECAVLIEGFDYPPFIMMTYNKPYYDKLYQNFGLKKSQDLFAYMVKSTSIPERLEKFVRVVQKRYNFKVRCLRKSKKELQEDIKLAMQIYFEAWKDNWGFVPMTEKEFQAVVDELLPIVERKLVFIAEVDGKPAGFSVALPNYNIILQKMKGKVNPLTLLKMLYYKKKIKAIRVITMGVIKEYQKKGIESVMIYHTFKNGLEMGYNAAETSWILEDNVEMNNLAKRLNADLYKKYRIYNKKF